MGLQSQPVRMQTLRLSFLRMPSVLLRCAVVTEPLQSLQSITEFVGVGYLSELGGNLLEDYDNDISSRKDWEKTYTEGLKLLGQIGPEVFP